MRISDWSSDVCSSDLQFFNIVGTGIYQSAPDAPTNTAIGINAADETIKGIELDATVLVNSNLNFSFTGAYTKSKVDRLSNPKLTGAALPLEQITLDRKSGVEGKSVSVRIDLGGLCSIKQKT